VAGQWRIRHKLMLGLGLVVAVMAILLGGTVYGLLSFRKTTNLMESKVNELHLLHDFKAAINELATGVMPEKARRDQLIERAFLLDKIDAALKKLDECRTYVQDTADRGHSDDKGWTQGNIDALGTILLRMRMKVNQDTSEMGVNHSLDTSLRSRCQDEIKELIRTTQDWEKTIYDKVTDTKREARSDYTQSFWIVGTTSVLSILLMAGLLRFFYNWVFHPVRDLMQGVERVAQGHFEYTIDIKSGDEMQELAAAFNDMTGRLREIYRSLAQQVNERSRQLVRSERLASVGFLAAGVAHEINNPLASIAFCSEALEARLAEILAAGRGMTGAGRADSEVIFKYLKMIQEEAFR